MFIYIVRHAWAGNFGDPTWPDDAQRPLTARGKTRFASVVRRLVKRGFAPRAIATSRMVRCRQTADIIAEHVAGQPKVVPLDALLPGSDLAALIRWTTEQPPGDVCWVGHSPDVSDLTAALVGGHDSYHQFAQATCAAVQIEGATAIGTGELFWLATAESLGAM